MSTETPWQRLSRLAYARIDQLGITQYDLEHVYGGPSGAWLRKLKNETGPVSSRQTRALRKLSEALGWKPDTARSLLVEDRSDWAPEILAAEEHELVYGDALTGTEQRIRDFATMVQARLRMLPEDEATERMRQIMAMLGGLE